MLLESIVAGNEHLQGLGLGAEIDFMGLESYIHICAHTWMHVSPRQSSHKERGRGKYIILANASYESLSVMKSSSLSP